MNISTSLLPINAFGNDSTIRVAYQHDLDRGMTWYEVCDFATGKTWSHEMPTKEFEEVMRGIAARCRVQQVRP